MCPGILQRRGLRLRQRLEGYAPGWQPHETSRSPQQDVETAFWQSFHFKSCGSFKAFEATPTITRNLLPGYVARDKAENENGGCQHQPNVVHRSHNAGPLAKSPRSLRSFCRAFTNHPQRGCRPRAGGNKNPKPLQTNTVSNQRKAYCLSIH